MQSPETSSVSVNLYLDGHRMSLNLPSNDIKRLVRESRKFIQESRKWNKWDANVSPLLMCREVSDGFTMVSLMNSKSLKDGCTIQIILISRDDEDQIYMKRHKKKVSSTTGCLCDICGEKISQQQRSCECTDCKIVFHRNCVENNFDVCNFPSESESKQKDNDARASRPKSYIASKLDLMKKRLTRNVEIPSSGNDVSVDGKDKMSNSSEDLGSSLDESINEPIKPEPRKGRVRSMLFLNPFSSETNSNSVSPTLNPSPQSNKMTESIPSTGSSTTVSYSSKDLTGGSESKEFESSKDKVGSNESLGSKREKSPTSQNKQSTRMIPLQRVITLFKTKKATSDAIYFKNWLLYRESTGSVMRRSFWIINISRIKIYQTKSTKNLQISIDKTKIRQLRWIGEEDKPSNHLFEFSYNSKLYYCGVADAVNDKSARKALTETGIGWDLAKQCYSMIESIVSSDQLYREDSALSDTINERSSSNANSEASVQSSSHSDSQSSKADADNEDDICTKALKKILESYQPFNEKYCTKNTSSLGRGQFGTVVTACRRSDGLEVAVKIINTGPSLKSSGSSSTSQSEAQKNELKIFLKIQHSGCVSLFEVMETQTMLLIIMERMYRECMLDLYLNFMKYKELPSEELVKFMMYQVCVAVKYLHSLDIAHCDLKPDNVLIGKGVSKSGYPQVKICDFGYSKLFDMQSFHKTMCGTPAYMAPEILENHTYDKSVDLWSVGIMFYVGLSLEFPYNCEYDIRTQIANPKILYPSKVWKLISSNAITLIDSLIKFDPKERPPIEVVLSNKWLLDEKNKDEVLSLEMELGENYLSCEFPES